MSERAYRNAITCGALLFSLLSFLFYEITYSPLSGGIVDDYVRYALGGFFAVAQIRGDSDLPRHVEAFFRIAEALRVEGVHPITWQSLFYAGVAYAPVMVPLTVLETALEPLRASLGFSRPLWWAGCYYVAWLALLVGVARSILRGKTALDIAWFLASGVFLSAVFLDGPPFHASPRGVTVLFTGLALHLLSRDSGSRAARILLAMAPFFHPYQQAINCVVSVVFVWVWARRFPSLRELLGWTIVPLAASFFLVYWMTPSSIYAAWQESLSVPRDSREAVYVGWRAFGRTFRIWLAFVGFFWAARGVRTAALFSIVFFAMLVLPLALIPETAELPILRLGNAWLACGLFLLLRRNLFLMLLQVSQRWRVVAATGFAGISMVVLAVYWRGFQCAHSLTFAPFGAAPLPLDVLDHRIIRFIEERMG